MSGATTLRAAFDAFRQGDATERETSSTVYELTKRKAEEGMREVAREALGSESLTLATLGVSAIYQLSLNRLAGPEEVDALLARVGEDPSMDRWIVSALAAIAACDVPIGAAESFLQTQTGGAVEKAWVGLYAQQDRWEELYALCEASKGARNLSVGPALQRLESGGLSFLRRLARELRHGRAGSELARQLLEQEPLPADEVAALLGQAKGQTQRNLAAAVVERGHTEAVVAAVGTAADVRAAASLAEVGARNEALERVLLRGQEGPFAVEAAVGLLELGHGIDPGRLLEVLETAKSTRALGRALELLRAMTDPPKAFAKVVAAFLTHADPNLRMLAVYCFAEHPGRARKGDVKKVITRIGDRDGIVAANACLAARQLWEAGHDVSAATKKLRALAKKAGPRTEETVQDAAIAGAVVLALLSDDERGPAVLALLLDAASGAHAIPRPLTDDAIQLLQATIRDGGDDQLRQLAGSRELPAALATELGLDR